MESRYILSPYYYGDPLAGLDHLAGADWARNEVELPAGTNPEKQTAQEMMSRMISIYKPLAAWVTQTIEEGHCAVTLSGDCSSSMALLTGVQNAGISPTFIWFDAHGDFNTWETTPSGFLGGMPLAIVSGRGEQMVPKGLGFNNVPDEQIILTDARELDPGEVSNLADSQITHLTDVSQLLTFPLPDRPVAIHFDVDVINLAEARAMSFPAAGGPASATLRTVFRHLAATGLICAVSISSWIPSLDEDGSTAAIVMDLLTDLVP